MSSYLQHEEPEGGSSDGSDNDDPDYEFIRDASDPPYIEDDGLSEEVDGLASEAAAFADDET
jgi:hypothetical protein